MTIHKYLRKDLLFLLSSSFLASLFLIGCQKQPDLLFGSTYTDEGTGANIVLVDSSTVVVSTIDEDSVATSSTGFLMSGTYNDDFLGRVSSRAYWRLLPPATLPTLDPRADNYDSIGLVLFAKTGNPYYGDTTAFQKYAVNQIDTIFDFANGQNGWFSDNSLPLGPELGNTSVRIFPNRPGTNGISNTSQGTGDTVRIPMDYALGQQLYNMVYNKSDTLINTTKWQRWFPGLCLSTPETSPSNLIYGFMDSAIMRIYYRENGVSSEGKFIDFNITDKGFQFNQIARHYGGKPDFSGHPSFAGKPIDNLQFPTSNPQSPPATVSSKVGNVGYVQNIGGLSVKLTFPNISSIALRPDYIGLLRATLTVRPVPGSYTTTWRMPQQVGIFSTDQNNLLLQPIPATGVAGSQTGNLTIDYFHPQNTLYTYDVTAFIKALLLDQGPTATQTGVILSVPAPANVSSFNRLIVADQSYPVSQRIMLNVYYISLYPHQ
ncbi:DUF4270 family protein [Puia sp.]|jgi:hypothetical protein|uniref:DUF4270 family protein n=1 Tax=Puia sp. TaxID=2045100 RepID=UPI002F3EC761